MKEERVHLPQAVSPHREQISSWLFESVQQVVHPADRVEHRGHCNHGWLGWNGIVPER